jgi:hypothetical protein
MTEAFDATPLIRKLETIFVLSDDEKNALQSISGGTVNLIGSGCERHVMRPRARTSMPEQPRR